MLTLIQQKMNRKGMRTMTNTSKTARIGMLLLVLCLISTAMLGGTFAKYTSEYAGQDTALVARWSFVAKGGDGDITMGAPAANTELKLFDHLYATHINQTDGVADPDTKFIIAPGVADEFTVKMNYIADVDADVLITITELDNNADVPVEYSVNGGTNWVTRANLAEALANRIIATNAGGAISASVPDADGSFRIAAVANNSVTPVAISETVKWKWRYTKGEAGSAYPGQTDVQDTALGTASQTAAAADITKRTTYGIKIDLKATQVAPE